MPVLCAPPAQVLGALVANTGSTTLSCVQITASAWTAASSLPCSCPWPSPRTDCEAAWKPSSLTSRQDKRRSNSVCGALCAIGLRDFPGVKHLSSKWLRWDPNPVTLHHYHRWLVVLSTATTTAGSIAKGATRDIFFLKKGKQNSFLH